MDLRERLLAEIAARPGAGTRELATRVGVAESTADYQLRRLARAGKLSSEFHGRSRAWFLKPCGFCPVLRRLVPAIRRHEARALAGVLEEDLAASAVEAAERAGLSAGSARWAGGVLESSGVVARTPSGRLKLRHGGRTCLAKAAAAEPCDAWGSCPVSVSLGGMAPHGPARRAGKGPAGARPPPSFSLVPVAERTKRDISGRPEAEQ